MPFVHCDGTRIYWRVDGRPENPPLLLVNSLGSDHAMWSPVLDGLVRAFRVIRMDTRGHGASDAPPGDYTLERLGRDALAVADAAGAARVHFAGVSLGGMTGMWIAAHAPERIDRLVLANTSASVDPANYDTRIAAVRRDGMAAVTEAVLERFFTPSYRARDTAHHATVRETLLQTDPGGYAGCCAAIRDMALMPLLPSIRAATLVIAGSVDPATPPDHGRRIAQAIPGASFVELPTAHFSHSERPVRFVDLVVPFLQGRAATTADARAPARRRPA